MDPRYNPRTVEEVFRDFKGRRAGIIRALTTDVEDFFQQCDPEKENLCLYGFPNENWEVNFPAEEVPPELPEPALGINFARDGMQEKDWKRLFGMINELPTTFEVVSGKSKIKAPPTNNNHSNSKSKPNNKTKSSEPKVKQPKPVAEDPAPAEEGPAAEEEDGAGGGASEGEHGETLCGACGESYGPDEFWICCDICEKWFHGKCVKITAAKAEHIKQYKCPSCTGGGDGGGGSKRARPS
ncbi:PHD finger protein ALFIN-LIKE 5 [Dichanthelium oligosanthes]|uniref:PHD finger protein ALFIN-LIKE n=1 Tax=Dichanthelium oligosanthes TaxID=888268 RepID=A0A1E5W119_9POAL|nr:PHD finger protein ALFIN-LIKE 5 [Dichanthelium oligosanthes]